MSNAYNRTKNICVLIVALILTLPAGWPSPTAHAGGASSKTYDWNGLGELIEAPADATVYVSLGELGNAVLASGTKVRLMTMPAFPAMNATGDLSSLQSSHSVLAAWVISGDLIVKLHPRARAFIKTGETIFSATGGSLFQAGWRNGKAFFDASDSLRAKLPDLGNWNIKLPSLSVPEPVAASSMADNLVPVEKGFPTEPKRFAASMRGFSSSIQPIGRVESLGVVKINQQAASHQGILWGSELIQAPEGSSARATLDGIGQVTLTGGSQARLTTPMLNGADGHRVLSASLLSGTLVAQLSPSVAAYAEAAGSTFLTSKVARFRVLMVEGRAIFEMIDGVGMDSGLWLMSLPLKLAEFAAVGQVQDPQAGLRRYIVRPVGLNSNLVVQARSTRQIQVRVTDENDRPVTGVPIIFSLGSSTGGSTTLGAFAAGAATARIFTDAQGIATTEFTAGAEPTAGSISATVEGTSFSWVGQINLIKVTPGFFAPQNMVPVMITAATAVTIGTIKAATKDDPVPVKPTGTTIIKP
jgi:hypothetical protein